jgi:BASS family bile acid:Na+ symporter
MWRKALTFYTRYFAIWVLVFGVIAYFWPQPFQSLREYNKWFFCLTMFGVGAVLHVDDFKRIAKRPVIVLIGTTAQFTIMPLGAFIVARLLRLPDELAVGLILAGSAPGAMASNVMSYVAKADTAYSVSLTTASTLLCPILTPGITCLLARGIHLDIPFWPMVLDVMIMVIIPLFVGFGVRFLLAERIEKVLPIFPAISVTFIIFICSLVIAANRNRLAEVTGVVLAAVLILNVYGMGSGYGVARLFRMNLQRRRTLAIEIGMQNAGLGATLALEHLGEKAAIPNAIFVFVCIITASIMASIWQRDRAEMPAPVSESA